MKIIKEVVDEFGYGTSKITNELFSYYRYSSKNGIRWRACAPFPQNVKDRAECLRLETEYQQLEERSKHMLNRKHIPLLYDDADEDKQPSSRLGFGSGDERRWVCRNCTERFNCTIISMKDCTCCYRGRKPKNANNKIKTESC